MDDETAGSPCNGHQGLPAVVTAPEPQLREKLSALERTIDQQQATQLVSVASIPGVLTSVLLPASIAFIEVRDRTYPR